MKQIIKKVSNAGAPQLNSPQSPVPLNGKRSALSACLVLICLCLCPSFVQGQTDDNVRFTQGDVNESATLSLGVPFGRYKGRGLDLPISLSYSSSVWRIEHVGKVHNAGRVQSVTQAVFAEYSAAGWKSTLDLPQVEFPKQTDAFDYRAQPYTSNTWNGCFGYRIARLFIHMPDGSTHEFRKSDLPYYSDTIDKYGTFYAIDNSRMRYDSTGPDTGTLYLPDGTRYVLGHPTSSIIDRNGNTQTYNETTRQWTDTLGRVIANPLPAGTPDQAQEYTFNLPGLYGTSLSYTFKWRNLSAALTPDALGNAPALRYMATHYLPNPTSLPSDSGNFPVAQSSQYQTLFQSAAPLTADENPIETIVVGKGATFGAGGQLFNPVVLAEIVLPDGTSYKFSYNVYGELDKVIYPTNAYEQYEFAPTLADSDQDQQPYIQAQRRVTSRKSSISGLGNDILEWKYLENAPYSTTGNPVDNTRYRVTSIIAPDKTRTEVYVFDPQPTNGQGKSYWSFGFANTKAGLVFQRKVYSSSVDGLGGILLRREITQYEQKANGYQFSVTCGQTPFSRPITAYRNPRPTKQVNITLEDGGPALAQTKTFLYDTTGEMSYGVDQTMTTTTHYAVVDNTTALGGTILQIPTGDVARYAETTFLNSPSEPNSSIYVSRNILGLPTKTLVRDSAYTIVSQNEMRYDESSYSPEVGRALPTSSRVWDSTKGPVTDANAFLMTRAKFDFYGNRIEATDAKGNTTFTQYDSTHQAYAVKFTTPIPDPNPSQNPDGQAHGSQSAFETIINYDYPTGLVMSKVDANGQPTQIEYNDPFLRPTRIIPPDGGAQIVTEYGLGTTPENSYIKVKKQVDATNWEEVTGFFDGVHRTIKTQVKDAAAGDIFTETLYDNMGRVKQVANPYRAGETKVWSSTEYDDLGRITKTIAPDGAQMQTSYGISTTGIVGVIKTNTDQAARKRRGITDALGRMVRVIEDPDGQSLVTDYVFDTLDNLRQTTQGEQKRYFMYDSLNRVLYSKQPEQEVNTALSATDPVTGNTQWAMRFTYDNNSNLVSTTDARGFGIAGTYDQTNRLIYRDYSDSTPDVSFYYDGKGLGQVPANAKGKTTKVSSSVSESRYTTFDNLGRIKSSQQVTNGVTYNFPDYSYNLAGDLISQTYPSGRVVKNTIDGDGNLTKVESQKNAGSALVTYLDQIKYTPSGLIKESRLGNGRWETLIYNARLQVKQIGLGTSSADQSLLKIEYDYGAQNNGSVREQKLSNSGLVQPIVQTYDYDALNRLQSATETYNGGTQSWKQTFSYDRFGNRRFDSANTNTLGSTPQAIANPLINTSDNRFSAGQSYGYDKSGNVTQDAENQRFDYDAENRQKQFFSKTNASTTPDATYQYNGEGKRVRTLNGQVETIFVYDATGQMIAEYSNQLPVNPKVSYLTTDNLGSPRIITDQNGQVVSRHDYMAFGEEVPLGYANRSTTPGYDTTDGIRRRYTGYERDNESGLDYAQSRYYNSHHGRFTSVDPLTASATIRNPQTFNRYSYVINSPYKFTDPLGLMFMAPGTGLEFNPIWSTEDDPLYCVSQTPQEKPPPPKKTVDKPYDPSKDTPINEEPGTDTPLNMHPIGQDEHGKDVYEPKNQDAYNCHSYAWEDGKGDPKDSANKDPVKVGAKKWDNDPTNNMKDYKQLDANAPNQAGDKVVYYVDENKNGKFDKGKDKVIHSANVVKVDGEGNPEQVRGKMGQGGLSTNHPRAPGYYDKATNKKGEEVPTSRAYFRKEEKKH